MPDFIRQMCKSDIEQVVKANGNYKRSIRNNQ